MDGGPVSGHTVIRLVAAEPDLEALPISPSYHWWQSGIKPPSHLGLITHCGLEGCPSAKPALLLP